ncbi:MAG TPA: hypothetical protein ENN28_03615 [Candidatus Uhrbacteria bacterium]|nr:hypothetical protein [Candidatus Uhrbacteria bacterium]
MALNLLNIFYSNSRLGIDYQAIDELNFLIKEKIINFSENKLAELMEFYKIIDKLKNEEIKEFDYQGGQIRHMSLKILGEKLLRNLNKKSKIENIFHNRYPDLISSDKQIIIECGDTDPNKIIEYFNLSVVKIFILPYPDNESDFLYFYEFTCNKKN